MSHDTKDGNRSIILAEEGPGGYAVSRDLGVKYLDWIVQGKEIAKMAARVEADQNGPFVEEEDPFDPRI